MLQAIENNNEYKKIISIIVGFLALIATVATATTITAPTNTGYKADITIDCFTENTCDYQMLIDKYPNYKILLNDLSVSNPILGCVVDKESKSEHYKPDGEIKRGSSGEYGVSQFMWGTFYNFAKQMNFVNADIMNPVHQLIVMSWAFNNGYEGHWTTLHNCQ